MDTDFIKLLADIGGMGVALVMVIAVYKFSSLIAPKFIDMVSNHFAENAAALRGLTDSIDELIRYLKKNNNK